MEFEPVPTRNQSAGWTAERQRKFIETLAATGSVFESACQVMLSPRSAYLLRGRKDAESFARAWDMALEQAGGRLLAHAFDRALRGGHRRVWKDGDLKIAETNPSDKLLMYLIDRIGPAAFRRADRTQKLATQSDLEAQYPHFEDCMPDAEWLNVLDFEPDPRLPPRD